MQLTEHQRDLVQWQLERMLLDARARSVAPVRKRKRVCGCRGWWMQLRLPVAL